MIDDSNHNEAPDQSAPREHEREHQEESPSRLRLLWDQGWTYLLAGILISLALHLISMLIIFLSPAPTMGDVEVEWMGRFGALTGIGHGAEDFNPQEEVDWDDLADFNPDEEGDPIEEEADLHEEEEIDPLEEPPQKEEIDESGESERTQEVAAAETPPEEGPGEGSPEPEEEAQESPRAEERPRERPRLDRVPGVDRSSPSNLPDLRNYGPGNARITALIRLDRLRGTDAEPHVNNLLRAVPDYRILLDGTNFNAVRDLDAIFMASADPTHLQQTFLAVRHSLDNQELRSVLDGRFADPVPWEVDGQRPVRPLVPETGRYRDPRRLMLAEPGLAIVGRPEWFSELIGPVSADSDLGRELAAAEGGPSAFQLLDGLARIEEVADQEGTLALVSAYGLIFFAPGVGRLPRFEAVRLALVDPNRPRLTIDLRFATTVLARDFARDCPQMQRQIVNAIPFARALGIASLVERLSCVHDGDYVTVTGEYTSRELSSVLQIAAPLMPRPRALTGLPPGPPPPAPEEELPTDSPLEESSPEQDELDQADEAQDQQEGSPRQVHPRRPSPGQKPSRNEERPGPPDPDL